MLLGSSLINSSIYVSEDEIRALDFKSLGRRGTRLVGQDAVDKLLHRADLQKQRFKAQHAAMLEQLKLQVHPMLRAANQLPEAHQADSMSIYSQNSSTMTSDVSLLVHADLRKDTRRSAAADIEVRMIGNNADGAVTLTTNCSSAPTSQWQASLTDSSIESRAAVRVAQRIMEREQCLNNVEALAKEAESEFLRNTTEDDQEIEVRRWTVSGINRC